MPGSTGQPFRWSGIGPGTRLPFWVPPISCSGFLGRQSSGGGRAPGSDIFLSRWVRGLPSNSGKALSSGLFGSFSTTFSQSLSCWVSSLLVTRMADPVMVEKTAVLHVLGLGLGLRLTCFVPFDKDHGSVFFSPTLLSLQW